MAPEDGSSASMASPERRDLLRVAFVEMLFALAVSQIAVQVANVLSEQVVFPAQVPALCHLSLALILIAASWVGWSQSQSPGMSDDHVTDIFSIPFIGLLMDVFLVILYFIVVQNAELEQMNGVTTPTAPTAVPEAFWVMIIFCTYAFWDSVTDVLSSGCIPKTTGVFAWTWKVLRLLLVSMFSSLVCVGLAGYAWKIADGRTGFGQVVLIDVALLCIVLFFRALKAVENLFARLSRITDCKAFERPRKIRGSEWKWGIGLVVVYLLCIEGAKRL